MDAQLTARLQSKSLSLRYRYAVGIRKNLTCALSAGLQFEGGIHDALALTHRSQPDEQGILRTHGCVPVIVRPTRDRLFSPPAPVQSG